MFKLKIIISVIIFSSLLITTSVIKNKTRVIEKKIFNLNSVIFNKEKDLNQSQLDFSYLTSPLIIEKKIYHLDNEQYIPMENSKIFLSISNFLDIQKRFVAYEIYNEKKTEKK